VAPNFHSTTVTGEPIALSEFRGEVVVLMFLPLSSSASCVNCSSQTVSPEVARLTSIWQAIEPFGEKVRMIAVSESVPTSEELPVIGEDISYIADPDIVRLYRRSYGAFVIDQQGVIRAMDEVWSKLVEGRPRGELDQLHASEIVAIAERLLDREDSGRPG